MLDPMGLYQIADSLAIELVPAVRERMQRVRFLTAMAVGALVSEGVEDNPRSHDASAYLVWEWLVVEALVRTYADDDALWEKRRWRKEPQPGSNAASPNDNDIPL